LQLYVSYEQNFAIIFLKFKNLFTISSSGIKFMEVKIGRSFKLTKKLGSGAFGEIFHGINLKTNMEVAVKLEPVSTKHP